MKKKIIGIFVCMLLIITTVLTVAGNNEQHAVSVVKTNATQDIEFQKNPVRMKQLTDPWQNLKIEKGKIIEERQIERLDKAPNPDSGHLKNAKGSPAKGGESDIYVYPRCQHGDKHRDVTNVQWAVDNIATSGIVHLMTTDPDDGEKKAFYFGSEQSVCYDEQIYPLYNISRRGFGVRVRLVDDIKIIGESSESITFQLPDGKSIITDRAIIYGGLQPIALVEKLRLDVENVHIENAQEVGIYVRYSNGINVSRCKILNVRQCPYWWGYQAMCIFLDNLVKDTPPEAISGYANIVDNELSPNKYLDPDYNSTWLSIGYASSYTSIEEYISGNRIYNTNSFGIMCDNNLITSTIVDNIIIPGPSQSDIWWFNWGTGIGINYHWWEETGSYYIMDNEITCENPIWGIGILFEVVNGVPGAEYVITGNDITVTNAPYAAIYIDNTQVHSLWHDNVIKGSGYFAIYIGEELGFYYPATNNEFYLTQSELDDFDALSENYVFLSPNAYDNTIDAPDIPCYRFLDLAPPGANTIICQ